MSTSYLPVKISLFSAWLANFSALLTASPATYGVTSGDAAAIAASKVTFDAAYAVSSVKATRTSQNVQTTQTARNATTVLVRAAARNILANSGVLDASKLALGLIIRDTVPSRIPVPQTSPVLGLVGATPGELTLTYRDQNASPKSRAKPAGVASLELHAFFGTVAPATPAATPFFRNVTRSPFAITCPSGSAGQDVWLYGRWVNAKGEAGPWSAELNTSVI
jgi:hypothetical protein